MTIWNYNITHLMDAFSGDCTNYHVWKSKKSSNTVNVSALNSQHDYGYN